MFPVGIASILASGAIGLTAWPASNFPATVLSSKLTGETDEGKFADNYSLDERYWKTADLSGQDLVFGQQSAGISQPAYIAYAKLVPLADDDVAKLLDDRARASNRRLICMNDGFSDFGRFRPTSREEIWEWLEPFRDTDFQKMFLVPGRGRRRSYLSFRHRQSDGKQDEGLSEDPRPLHRRVDADSGRRGHRHG